MQTRWVRIDWIDVVTEMIKVVCSKCGEEYPLGTFLPCRKCGNALMVEYDLDSLSQSLTRKNLESRRCDCGVWKYQELLPLGKGRIVSLSEGGTPLIRCERLSEKIGLKEIYVKNEGVNPTGSFKDRYATVLVSHAIGQGVRKIYCFSTGNHAAALSCYTARAGLRCLAFVYPGSSGSSIYSEIKLAQSIFYGAAVVTPIRKGESKPRGLDFYRVAYEKYGWYPAVVQPINPYLIEGYKTMAYEICEQLDWKAPDVVIMPTESGDGLLGLWKGFKEFNRLGLISNMPRMIASQWGNIKGRYTGHEWSKRAIDETKGTVVYPTVEESITYMKTLARDEGLLVEPISASSIAGIPRLIEESYIEKDDVIVAIATGSGIKHPNLAYKLAKKPMVIHVGEELKVLSKI